MTVYYTESGLTYHYSRNCVHLKRSDPDRIRTVDETEVDPAVCQECENQRETVDNMLAQLSH